jgi:hypothetical protein
MGTTKKKKKKSIINGNGKQTWEMIEEPLARQGK